VALAAGLAWIALSRPAMMAIFGADFAPGGAPLRWMAVVCVLAALSGHYRFGLIAAGRQQAEMWISVIGALVAWLAIPAGYFLMGISGAAVGLLIAEVAVWLSAWWCGRSMLGLRGHAKLLLGPSVVAATTVLVYGWATR
jgi:O-antigen/teichoic acid export membrane protein